MADVPQHRHQQVGYTEADWTGIAGDPVLPARVVGWVFDTGEHVIGDGTTAFSGLTRYGGSVVSGGQATASGDGTATVFAFAHGLTAAPTSVVVSAGSADADGDFFVTHDATNVTVTYATAPVTGTNNLTWNWLAI